jgi:hypothetical protein
MIVAKIAIYKNCFAFSIPSAAAVDSEINTLCTSDYLIVSKSVF